jgi:hypothetical protein
MRFALILLALIACSCGVITWKTVYASHAPGSNAAILLRETGCLGDCKVRIIAQNGWREVPIADKYDCSIAFAHAAWVDSIVALFADGTSCGEIRVAYDTASHRTLDFNSYVPTMRASILKEYAVTPAELRANHGDIFFWVTGDQSLRARKDFQRRQGS